MTVTLLTGDVRNILLAMPADSVHCIVTSPPYYGLRDYGTAKWEGGDAACDHVVGKIRTGEGMAKLGEKYKAAGLSGGGGHKVSAPKPLYAKDVCPKCGAVRIDQQIGRESTLDEYLSTMVAVMRECRRVLRRDGVAWVNIGDSYATGTGTARKPSVSEVERRPSGWAKRCQPDRVGTTHGLKTKDLLLVPHRLAIALQEDGWWVRSDTIWSKPNPMPESITDRPSSAHEHILMLTKSARYFYDHEAVMEGAVAADAGAFDGGPQRQPDGSNANQGRNYRQPKGNAKTFRGGVYTRGAAFDNSTKMARDSHGNAPNPSFSRNLRNVWTIASHPFPDAHFATFPPRLAEIAILASTSAHGCCKSCGAPWRRVVEKGSPDVAHQRACGGDASGAYAGQSTKDHDAAGVQNASDVKRRILAGLVGKSTVGWEPTCTCKGPPGVVPCTVLDPFAGAGTTLLVADRLQRNAIGIELNPEYVAMVKRRIARDSPLFAAAD